MTDLLALWRNRADLLRPYAPSAARAFEDAAVELERALASDADEILTLAQAAQYSRYSVDHLRREIRRGRLENVGRRHAPRVRRGALPRKGPRIDEVPSKGYDPAADARQVTTVRTRGGER